MRIHHLAAEDFSHNDFENPFPFYEKMRAQSPAYQSERVCGGAWLFFGYQDCLNLLREERLSNARAAVPLWYLPEQDRAAFADMLGVYERWLAFHDGSEHTRNRRQLNHSYRPFSEEMLESRIQGLVDGLLNSVDTAGFDLMTEFALPLPAMVIADVLGVPVEAHPDLSRWIDDIAPFFGSNPMSGECLKQTQASTRELVAFLGSPQCATHSARCGGLLHQLRTTEVRGARPSEEDVAAQAALLLFAGVTSTRYLIGNSVHALAQRPAQERQLLLRPETVAPAVEELLRFCTPMQFVGRVAREDFSFTTAGQEILLPAGRPVMLYVASANRDPQQFSQADELVLTRPAPNNHLTLSTGRHRCFGAPLLRQTLRIALTTLYRRMPSLRLEPQNISWDSDVGLHGFTSLRVAS